MYQQRLIKSKGLFRHSTSVSAAHHSWNMRRWCASLRSASSSIKLGGRLGWETAEHSCDHGLGLACDGALHLGRSSLAPLLLNGPLAPWQPDGVVPRLDRGPEELLDGGHRCCCPRLASQLASQRSWSPRLDGCVLAAGPASSTA